MQISWIPWNLSFRCILFNEERLQTMLWHHNTRNESKCGSAFAFIFGVNWLWRCVVTASFEVFFREIKCKGMTGFMEFMIFAFARTSISSRVQFLGIAKRRCWEHETESENYVVRKFQRVGGKQWQKYCTKTTCIILSQTNHTPASHLLLQLHWQVNGYSNMWMSGQWHYLDKKISP